MSRKWYEQPWFYVLLILIILVIDQAIKVWVKLNMALGEEIFITPWFRILFTENYGMAFGLHLGGEIGKLILTFIRLGLLGFFTYLLYQELRRPSSLWTRLGIALIIAGALGNIIDSVFYGVLFTESTPFNVARFAPGQGYASLFHGRVVDMLFFPIWQGHLPDWLPIIGGQYFLFFAPVFNIADSAITIGFILWAIGTLLASRSSSRQ